MNNNIFSIILGYKKALIAFLIVLTVTIIGIVAYLLVVNRPINLAKTNLKDASDQVKQKATDQLTISISNLPNDINNQTKKFIENNLAYSLRQKYGIDSVNLTANVRKSEGYDDSGYLILYVDIPAKNETYYGMINTENNNGSFSCAPQDMQMNPKTSKCSDDFSVDDSFFPNG